MEDVLRQRRKRGIRVAILVLISIGALLGVYFLRDIFTPLVLGFLLAYVLDEEYGVASVDLRLARG